MPAPPAPSPSPSPSPSPAHTHPTRPARKRRTRRILGIIAAALALLIVGGIGWGAWASRAQGDPEAVEFADATLSPTLTDATVLALGEATHGNHEFQVARQQLLEKVVPLGFRAVVFEDDFGSVTLADAYIQGGPGTPIEAAKAFGFAINKTTETVALLTWLRELNANLPAEQRVRLYGMDVQRVDAKKDLALGWLARHDPETAARLTTDLAPLTDEAGIGPRAGEIAARTAPAATELLAAIDDWGREDRPGATDPAYPIVRRAAHTLLQNTELEQQTTDYMVVRDAFMADNLAWIVDREQGRGKVVVIAHNGHVDKISASYTHPNTGQLAAERWGDGYRVIGSEFHHTRFLASDGSDRREFEIENRTPLRGMYAGTRVGYLDIAAAGPTNRRLLNRTVAMGSAGEPFIAWQARIPALVSVPMVPARAYDALILVPRATPVTMA